VLRLASLLPLTALATLGRYSLQIFLLHPFVWQALWRLGLQQWLPDSGQQALLFAALTFVLTLALTLLLVKLIAVTGLQRWLFPRSWAQWRHGHE